MGITKASNPDSFDLLMPIFGRRRGASALYLIDRGRIYDGVFRVEFCAEQCIDAVLLHPADRQSRPVGAVNLGK
jgi:hypothetical protein